VSKTQNKRGASLGDRNPCTFRFRCGGGLDTLGHIRLTPHIRNHRKRE
jgi:hypothetical protein